MSFGQPASIDNLTAIMRLPLLQDEGDLRRLLSGQSPAHEHLMSFMHEVTHHLCFRTGPVGPAAALLESRATSSAYFAGTRDDHQKHQAATFDAVARSRGVTELLRPLAEGLALFSEFDSVSGKNAKVHSQVYMAAKSLFINLRDSEDLKAFKLGKIDVDEFAEKSDRAILRLIWQERTHPRAIERKLNLLLQPIDPSMGGYLPGYLCVKDLYYRCANKTPVLYTEADLFLCYIVQYIFGDPVLAAALVDPRADAHEALSAFADRLYARLHLLPQILTNESLEGLQRSMLQKEVKGLLEFIGISEEDYANSWPTIAQFNDEMKLAVEDPEDPFGVLNHALVNHRNYMYMGELSADVSFDHGYAWINLPSRGRGIRAPVFKTLEAGKANTVHLISPLDSRFCPLAVLYENDDRILALSWGLWLEKDQEGMTTSLLEDRYPVRATRDLMKTSRDAISYILEASGNDVELEDLMDQLSIARQTLYFPTARDPAEDAELANLRLRMARYGLGGLLDDPDVVRRLARLGLASSLTHNYEALSGIFERLGWGALDDEIALLVKAADQIWPIRLLVLGNLTGDRFVAAWP
jgi:hypothetical protein